MKINLQINRRFKVLGDAFFDSLKNTLTDRGAILIILFAGIAYPIVYGIGYSKEVIRELPVAVIDNDQTSLSRQWIDMLDDNPSIKVAEYVSGMPQAKELFWTGEVYAILHVPSDFETKITQGQQAHIGMYADASNFLFYKETMKATMLSSGMMGAGVQIKKLMLKGLRQEQAMAKVLPFQSQMENLYNPAGGYGSFVMPGLTLVIIQQTLLLGIGLLGGAGRERKREKTFLEDTGFSSFSHEVILGKAFAFFTVGLLPLLISVIILSRWFGYPDKGAMLDVFVLVVPYLFAVIFMGLAISLLFKHREHAIMVLVFLSPIILFVSGLSWPTSSIPLPLQWLFSIFPSTHMVPAYIRLRTMGVSILNVKPEFLFLLVQVVIYYFMSVFGLQYAMKKNKV